MPVILRRFGLRFSRGLAITLLMIGMAIGAAFWIGPMRPPPARLELVALAPDGRFVEELALAPAADTSSGAPRFPLVLAVRNVGPRATQPATLSLSLPVTWRLIDRTGEPLPAEYEVGVPLSRYTFRLPFPDIAAGATPALLPGVDTLWLSPRFERIVCAVGPDGVPELVPASIPPAADIATPTVFYSFGGRELDARHTGVLSLRVDPSSIARSTPPLMPTFPASYREPEITRPETGVLTRSGVRDAQCGEPDRPVEIQSVVWRTEAGGRMIVVYHGGAPRRQLFDVDGDGIIETEMWDPDGDGRFEGRRRAQLPIPEFLLPLTTGARLVGLDTLPADSVWFALLRDTAAGPLRFSRIDSVRSVADSVRAAAAVRRAASVAPGVLGVPVNVDPPRRDTARDTTGAIPAPGVSSRDDRNPRGRGGAR